MVKEKLDHKYLQINQLSETGFSGKTGQEKSSEEQLDLNYEMEQINVIQQKKQLSIEARVRNDMKLNHKNATDHEIRQAIFREHKKDFSCHFQQSSRGGQWQDDNAGKVI